MRPSLFFIISLICVSCGESSPKELTPNQNGQAANFTPTNRVKVPGGMFIFGASEDQFQLYISGLKFNYPGLLERLRNDQNVPSSPQEVLEFEIDEFEVTNQQFSEFISKTGYSPKNSRDYLKHWEGKNQPPEWAMDFPVVWVSKADGEAYCKWTEGRLPNEMEWEKAARGLRGQLFPWGENFPDAGTANVGSDRLEPIGNRPGDQSPYSVYDLAGNVSELTSSLVAVRGNDHVVVKGGNYRSAYTDALVYSRNVNFPAEDRSELIGFRCVSN